MTKSELVVRLSSHFPKLVTQDTEAVVKVIIDALANTLADAKRAELRGFGSFKVNKRGPREGRNPRSGELVSVPGKSVPHFRPGKELRERVRSKVRGKT